MLVIRMFAFIPIITMFFNLCFVRLSFDSVKVEHASITNGDEVHVTWADDPYNFRVKKLLMSAFYV